MHRITNRYTNATADTAMPMIEANRKGAVEKSVSPSKARSKRRR